MSGETLSPERGAAVPAPGDLEWEGVWAALATPEDFAHGSATLSHGSFAS